MHGGVDERLAMASAVHDGPLQLLMAALQELDDRSEVAYARQLVADAVAGLRDVLGGADSALPGWELEARLEDWCEQLGHQHAATFRVTVSAERPVARLVFDAARELLTNAARHSAATTVNGYVEDDAVHGITVCVIDNGCGMPARGCDGYGLQVLRRRIELAGGTLHHRALVAGGTVAHVRLPATLDADARHDAREGASNAR